MLKEFILHQSLAVSLTPEEFDALLTQELLQLIHQQTPVDTSRAINELTLKDFRFIVRLVKDSYEKILDNHTVDEETINFIASALLSKLFEILRDSSAPVEFFKLIQKNFSSAQIVAALMIYMGNVETFERTVKFFCDNPQLFPTKNKKIRTIAMYYKRMYSGGIERVLSIMIPIYLQMGYRVVLFTDEYKPDLEYELPINETQFKRIVLDDSAQPVDRYAEIERHLRKESVDLFILHEHLAFPPIVQILLAKFCGAKVVVQFHGYLAHYVEYKKFLAYRLADSLVTLSSMAKDFWRNFGAKVQFVPHPIGHLSAENFHGRNPKNCSNTILYVGRITNKDDKNTFAILPILNEVVKAIPNAKLKILGEVWHEETFDTMQQFIAENNLEDNVEFLGYRKDVGRFYEAADVILSTSPTEGWGLFIVESKFYELPLVLYELPDVELLRDGKGHVAVPQGDFRGAAHAIIKILTDTDFRCKLSKQARESLQPFIDYDIVGAWKKIFDDVETNAPVLPHDVEKEKIQDFLVREIWKLQDRNQMLISYIQTFQAEQ